MDGDTRPPLRLIAPPPPVQPRKSVRLRPDPDGPSMLEIIQMAAQAAWDAAVDHEGNVNVDKAITAAHVANLAVSYTSPKLAAVVVRNVDEEAERLRKVAQSDADQVRARIEGLVDKMRAARA